MRRLSALGGIKGGEGCLLVGFEGFRGFRGYVGFNGLSGVYGIRGGFQGVEGVEGVEGVLRGFRVVVRQLTGVRGV